MSQNHFKREFAERRKAEREWEELGTKERDGASLLGAVFLSVLFGLLILWSCQ